MNTNLFDSVLMKGNSFTVALYKFRFPKNNSKELSEIPNQLMD